MQKSWFEIVYFLQGRAEIFPFDSPLISNPHLLTILSHFWPSRLDLNRFPVERRLYPTEPGVSVLVETQRPQGPAAGEVVLVHGLEGSSASGYMKSSAQAVLEAGFAAHRFNLRSCGGAPAKTGYHSGLTSDLLAFLRLVRAEARAPIFLVGFSLGGNVALKLAGELGGMGREWLNGVCAVSTPIDLAASVRCLEDPGNFIYQRRFVRRLKRKIRRLSPEIQGLNSIRTVRDFDDRITAPAFGFRDAAHYYTTQSCWQFFDEIRVPALLIQAKDDPVVPFAIFARPGLFRNPNVRLLASEHGGHLGFLSRRRPRFWLGSALVEWMRSLSETPSRASRPPCAALTSTPRPTHTRSIGEGGLMDHISDDELDRYAARSLPEAETAAVEEHLIMCEFCQDRLQLTDEFIAALRAAVQQRRRPGKKKDS